MNINAYQSNSNLSIIFAEVLQDNNDLDKGGWLVQNPMSLTMVPSRDDPSGQNLVPTLFPVFFTQVMTVDDYILTLSNSDYVDISERFVESFFDKYRNLNTSADEVEVNEEPSRIVTS